MNLGASINDGLAVDVETYTTGGKKRHEPADLALWLQKA
jgi:hypothetical protein